MNDGDMTELPKLLYTILVRDVRSVSIERKIRCWVAPVNLGYDGRD